MDSNKGISPAVGVILLIGITAAVATLAGIVLLDLGSPSQSAQAGIETVDTPNGVEVSWNQQGFAESVKVIVDGQEIATLNGVNESVTIGANKGSTVSIIGVKDGDEQVISKTETEYDTGSGTVKDYNANTETVSGSVSINPDIPNATVKSVANGQVLETTTTDSNGAFTIGATKNAKLQVIVKGFTYNSNPELYASDEKNITSMSDPVNFEFESSNAQTVSINGSNKWIINNSDANGNKTIGSVEQLQSIKNNLSVDYKLISDIDASKTKSEPWNSGNGFEPIGTDGSRFSGTFNGNGYTIDNLYIDRNSNNIGLFGYTEDSVIKNLTLSNVDISGEIDVGGLVGHHYQSKISNTSVNGTVDVKNSAGIVVGRNNESLISDSSSSGTITFTNAGIPSFVMGAWSGSGVGGLVGTHDSGEIINSHTNSTVTGSADASEINAAGRTHFFGVGGLVGTAYYYKGSSTSPYLSETGIKDSYADVSVDVSVNNKPLSDDTQFYTGGLAGYIADSSVENSYSEGTVSVGDDNIFAGGLVGYQKSYLSEIIYSHSTADVSGSDTSNQYADESTGGLVGTNAGKIYQSYSTGDVTGHVNLGGLVGQNDGSNAEIKNSYSKSRVNGDEIYGGLVGNNSNGEVKHSFAVGVVPELEGGSIGSSGLVRRNYDTVTESYWDTEATGNPRSEGGTGLTTSEMQGENASSNLTGFDFTDVWTTTDGYPELQNNREP